MQRGGSIESTIWVLQNNNQYRQEVAPMQVLSFQSVPAHVGEVLAGG